MGEWLQPDYHVLCGLGRDTGRLCQELLSPYCGVYTHILTVADSLLIIHHR